METAVFTDQEVFVSHRSARLSFHGRQLLVQRVCDDGWPPGNLRDLDHLAERVLAFQDRYNTTAAPFDWNYTREDLNNFLTRLDEPEMTRRAA